VAANVGPSAVLDFDQALGAKLPDRLADRASRCAELLDELSFTRDLIARGELPAGDQSTHMIGDLPVHRSITQGVCRHPMALHSSTRQVESTSAVITVKDQSDRHSVSVAAAIIDQLGRVLVIRRADTGAWELPGGVLELDETIHHGLRREVREETGLDIQPERLTGVYKNMARGIVALVFRCRVIDGQLLRTAETAEHRWLTSDQVRDHVTPAFAVRILDAYQDGQPAIRSHDGIHVLEPDRSVLPN
jgi:8-oxo-dGTP diphosphatase